MRHSLSECILVGVVMVVGIVCVCVKVDENERENKRGKIDINGYELAWPTIFFFIAVEAN